MFADLRQVLNETRHAFEGSIEKVALGFPSSGLDVRWTWIDLAGMCRGLIGVVHLSVESWDILPVDSTRKSWVSS